jgi:hypothetical protein
MLAKWDMIYQPREQGGLGIQYLTNQTIGKVKKKPSDSQFWTGLMNAKPNFLRYRSFQIKNGRQIRFWEDKWLGNYSFQQ